MVVISLTDCPPKLRGDLSKWLCEINTGVYVGNISVRVRDKLWDRICENIKTGQATMVYGAAGEQRMGFRAHNTNWKPVDFDGIQLMKRPLPGHRETDVQGELTKTRIENISKINRIRAARQKRLQSDAYVVIDLETTGLSIQQCDIIEMAALRIEQGEICDSFHQYVRIPGKIPQAVRELTGITDEMLQEEGKGLKETLASLLEFMRGDKIVSHNAAFDVGFIQSGCRKAGIRTPGNPCVDTLVMARRKVRGTPDYKLSTLVKFLGLEQKELHRAYNDCYLTYRLYEKLKEI